MSTDTKTIDTCSKTLRISLFVLALLLIAPEMMFSGWSLHKLWGWFVAEPFAIRQIGVALGAGIMVTVRFVFPSIDVPAVTRTPSQLFGRMVGTGFGTPELLVFIGWLIHRSMY